MTTLAIATPHHPAAHGDALNEGRWKNHKGRFVHPQHVSQFDKSKEVVMLRIWEIARSANATLKTAKADIFGLLWEFNDGVAADAGLDAITDKGNGTYYNYDQTFKLQVNSAAVIAFDARIKAALDLIRECLQSWSKDSNANLATVVEAALEVDGKGNLNPRRLLALGRLSINDEVWEQAIHQLREAVIEVDKLSYVNCYEKVETEPQKFEWKHIPLSLAQA